MSNFYFATSHAWSRKEKPRAKESTHRKMGQEWWAGNGKETLGKHHQCVTLIQRPNCFLIDRALATRTLPKFPSEFLGIKKDGKAVVAAMNTHFPGIIPRELPSASPDGRLVYPRPLPTDGEPLDPARLPYLAIRFDCLISKHAANQLVRAWDLLLATPVVFPPPEKNRSATPALHLGVWELSQSRPYVTADTCQKSLSANRAIDFLLSCIGIHVAPKITQAFRAFCPAQHARLMR